MADNERISLSTVEQAIEALVYQAISTPDLAVGDEAALRQILGAKTLQGVWRTLKGQGLYDIQTAESTLEARIKQHKEFEARIALASDEELISLREEAYWSWQQYNIASHRAYLGLPYSAMSERDFIATLPAFKPQPPGFVGRFNKSLLIDPRPNLEKQVGGFNMRNVKGNLAGWNDSIETPDEPYQIWYQDGSKYLGMDPQEVLENLPEDEEPFTLVEGMNLLREYSRLPGDHINLLFAATTKALILSPNKTYYALFKEMDESNGAINRYLDPVALDAIHPRTLIPTKGVLKGAA